MNPNKQISNTIHFRRFSRKAYAVFVSLHRVISIGHLAISTANCQQRKASHQLTYKYLNLFDFHNEQSDEEYTDALICQTVDLIVSPVSLSETAPARAPFIHNILSYPNTAICSILNKQPCFFISNTHVP